jgi:hypothetical protein
MTTRPPSTIFRRQASIRPCIGARHSCSVAFALFLTLVLAQAASARSYPALDDWPGYMVSSRDALESVLSDTAQVEPASDEGEVQLAMLEIGPMLYALALADAPDQKPPAWRTYAVKSGIWLAVFVLMVSTSAAMVERRAQRRRSVWRRRAAGLYR